MKQIFISYKREDNQPYRHINELIIKNLKTRYAVFHDEDIEKGKNYEKEIEYYLNNSVCGVVLMSPQSRASPWVIKECDALIRQNKLLPYF